MITSDGIPILFNFFINDIHRIFDQTPNLLNIQLNSLLQADGLILISETSSGLQNSLNRLVILPKKANSELI